MRSQGIISGPNTSPSLIKKKLRTLQPPGYNMTIEEMLTLASQKINPLVERLVDNANNTGHFIRARECDDIEDIANIIIDAVKALESIGFKTNIKSVNLDTTKYRENTNSQGYIYVNTTLLLEILELYNLLEGIKDDLDDYYRSIGIHSFVQTESDLLSFRSNDSFSKISGDSLNPNKIIFKLKKSPTKGVSSYRFLQNDLIVMPSINDIPLKDSKSQMLQGSAVEENPSSIRRVRSASSVENEQVYTVTDVYGARKVLVRCIYDLQEVSNYLSIPRRDASTICSRVEVNSVQESSGKTTTSIPESYDETPGSQPVSSGKNEETPNEFRAVDSENRCCCPECFASRAASGSQEGQDDQVIICIKGCNEDEGDVQIVIRQCPDCKKAEEAPTNNKVNPEPQPPPKEPATKQQQLQQEVKPKVEEKVSENRTKEIESTILHNKDSKGSIICSDEEEEEKPKEKRVDYQAYQTKVSCSRIKLFETTNLCLKTETGQELVISLTVTPKELAAGYNELSLTNIFSDNEYTQSSEPSQPSKQDIPNRRTPISKSPANYFVADRYIPLGRTKLCSSLDFDVSTEKSRIRDKGIQNKNKKIVVQLEEFGTDNLLRACRPAKCCRKAILNEKLKKCLPYAPSLRSLPLDDEDMQTINQSLQMSLQKVKNSTNLKKDYNTNQVYFMNPVHTVMYFFIEEDQDQKETCQNNLVKQKLNYYINLVNDIQCKPKSKYDILYFGVEAKLGKKRISSPVTTCPVGGEDRDVADLITNPLRWIKQKYGKYDETPVITGRQLLSMEDELLLPRYAKNAIQTKICTEMEPKVRKKKSFISRIPVYQKHKASPLTSSKIDDTSDYFESEVHNVSWSSLPPQQVTELSVDLSSPAVTPIKENRKSTTEHLINKRSVIIQSFDECNSLPKSKNSSKYSMTGSLKKSKRKKKEFYLSRSRSEISLNTLKHMCKNKSVCPVPRVVPKKPSTEVYSKKVSRNTSQSTNPLSYQDSSKIILNYFTRILYEMIVKQMFHDKLFKETGKKSKQHIHVSVGTDKASLHELYRKPRRQTSVPLHKSTRLSAEVSYYDLKAKQSQYCIVQATDRSSKSICIFNNLALQTSHIFGDNKKCQTSNTLLAYIINSNIQLKKSNFHKKRILKKSYNADDSKSCDEMENFIVTYNSQHSFSTNFSERDFVSNVSSCRQLNDSDQEDSLSQSLIKLKETLETYENVKNEIAKGSLQEANINPIEFFVYQVCACNNKASKKPSVMKKILSKTKGLFSSVDKDICKKYRNQSEFLSMSPADREELCHRCGCYISKCGEPPNKPAPPTLLCKCPQENKAKKNKFEPCCKKFKDPKLKAPSNLSRITSASSSSLQIIKACIKKSVSDVLSYGKTHSAGPCSCGKKAEKIIKDIQTVCIPKNMTAIPCEKTTASTYTTKDSSTQKCECGKCENFADDGTCCCSHCLGCLDKSFEAKPDNQSVGIETEEKNKSASDTNKSGSGQTLGSPQNASGSIKSGQSLQSPQNKSGSIKDTQNSSGQKLQSPSGSVKGDQNVSKSSLKSQQKSSEMPQIEEQNETVITNYNQAESIHTNPALSNNNRAEDEANQDEPINDVNSSHIDCRCPTQQVDIDAIDTSDAENNNNNDTTAFFFVTPPPHLFQQLGFSGRNPFEQYLLNFPQMNMFHLDEPGNIFKE